MAILNYESRRRHYSGSIDAEIIRFLIVQGINIGVGSFICWMMIRQNLGWGAFLMVPLAGIGIAVESCTLSLWGLVRLSEFRLSAVEWLAGVGVALAGPMIAAGGTWWGFMHAHGC